MNLCPARCLRAVRFPAALVLCLAFWASLAEPAHAHAAQRAFVLLLPTEYYRVGGTLAVAASFIAILFVPVAALGALARGRLRLFDVPRLSANATSLASAALLLLLLLAGLVGSRDPLANPLPLAVWTLWWVGFTLAQAALGDLWAYVNPWAGPYRLLVGLARRAGLPAGALLAYPPWLGYWPAVGGFLAFAWFELVFLAPEDPHVLAVAVAIYSAVTLMGMGLFGEIWLARGEAFSIFFGLVARLSPLIVRDHGPRRTLYLAYPGAALVGLGPLPASGVAFVLLILSAVSYDGLGKTFWWLDLCGANPLEHPGRTALMGCNSFGLVATWAALSLGYALAVWVGRKLGGGRFPLRAGLGHLVASIMPISLGYHFAHYLSAFLVNVQHALAALSDPFGRGWDLLSLGDRYVSAGILANYDSVATIWKLQAAGVVGGHVLAVSLAHLIATQSLGAQRVALLGQVPLAALMVLYTLFGFWLLATPVAG